MSISIEQEFERVSRERRKLESIKTRNRTTARRWATLLLEEKRLSYQLVIPLFIKEGFSVCIPYCGREATLTMAVESQIGPKGKLYLVDKDQRVVDDLRRVYVQPNVEIVPARLPRTSRRVPKNLDVVIARDIYPYLEEKRKRDILSFLDMHLRDNGYFLDFLFTPEFARYGRGEGYRLSHNSFNRGKSVVKVYQRC